MEKDTNYEHTPPKPLGLKDQGLRWMKFIRQGIPEVITPENFPGLPSRDIALGQFAARSSAINQLTHTAFDQNHPDHLLYCGLLITQTRRRDQELRVFIQTQEAQSPPTEPEQHNKTTLTPVEQADMLVIFRECGFTDLITPTLFPDIEEQNIDLSRLSARSNLINRLEFNETITNDDILKVWFTSKMENELMLLEKEKQTLNAKYSGREIEPDDSSNSSQKDTPDQMEGGYL